MISSENAYFPDCCIFGQPWEPAAPDFANNLPYNKTIDLCDNDETIDFYIRTMWDNNTEYNVFGYGFSKNLTTDGTNSWRKGARFFMLGYEGWISQFFYDFEAQKPDPSVFELPDICKNAPLCYYLQPTTTETITDPTSKTTMDPTSKTTMDPTSKINSSKVGFEPDTVRLDSGSTTTDPFSHKNLDF
uniref:Uncharacterized protein n=1 Tax=Acrobeloides nanus TaxID=290746 RepID=A0A914C7A7_9BILA